MAVYGTSLGESNGAVEGHTAHRARMSAAGYQPTYEWLSRSVRSPLESRPGSRAIQQVGNQCLVPATKRTLDVTRVYARL